MEQKLHSSNKLSETFDNFGEQRDVIEIVEVITIVQEVEQIDYNSLSVEEIIKTCNFEVIPKEEVVPNFTQVYVHNKYQKFYLAKTNRLGPCSMVILNDVEKKKESFGNLLSKLSKLKEIQHKSLLNVKGVSINGSQVYLFFEPVMASYRIKLKNKSIYDANFKFIVMYQLIELMSVCHEKDVGLIEMRPSNLLVNSADELRFIIPYSEFSEFLQSHENKVERVEEEFKFDRYRTPEAANEGLKDLSQDIWNAGCLFLELFSTSEVWQGLSEEEMNRDLKKYFVPKIPKDIPKYAWGVICECLNPFKEARFESSELLERYVRILLKLKIPELNKDLEKFTHDGDLSKLNTTLIDGEDPKAIRKCPLHVKNESSTFCAQCGEVICDQCRRTVHMDHASKGVFFDYLDFINLARLRIHSYKEKFNQYIIDANVPKREVYDVLLQTNENHIEKLHTDQLSKIEEQFTYLSSLLEQLKILEVDHLAKNKDFFKALFGKILDNYTAMNYEIDEVHKLADEKEELFLKFQDMDQMKKEECMKNVSKDENVLNFKKKNLIKYVSNFHKESSSIERLKRYFEMFIEKYKENKINDLVKVLEKKIENIRRKYTEIDMNEYLKILIYEFEQIALTSSRNYFNSTSKELFISIVNTNKIFSYNLDAGKYFITEVDFKAMPINRFPNYSRSTIINGNLLVNGGYDENTKVTLPYFFFYDRMNKSLTRLNDMLYGHSAHSIIYIPHHYVIVVSGSGILKCEQYDMETNTWTEMPDINVPRQNCTLHYYNKQFLYAFGGAYWDDTKKSFIYVESVERLDLGFGTVEGGTQWEQIQTYKLGKEINLRKSVMSVLSFSANKVLLVGGSISYNTYSDESILFDFEKNEFSIKEGVVLPKKTCFPNKMFMYSGEKAYQLDNDGNVFEYDGHTEKFTIIKENSVLNSTKQIK